MLSLRGIFDEVISQLQTFFSGHYYIITRNTTLSLSADTYQNQINFLLLSCWDFELLIEYDKREGLLWHAQRSCNDSSAAAFRKHKNGTHAATSRTQTSVST